MAAGDEQDFAGPQTNPFLDFLMFAAKAGSKRDPLWGFGNLAARLQESQAARYKDIGTQSYLTGETPATVTEDPSILQRALMGIGISSAAPSPRPLTAEEQRAALFGRVAHQKEVDRALALGEASSARQAREERRLRLEEAAGKRAEEKFSFEKSKEQRLAAKEHFDEIFKGSELRLKKAELIFNERTRREEKLAKLHDKRLGDAVKERNTQAKAQQGILRADINSLQHQIDQMEKAEPGSSMTKGKALYRRMAELQLQLHRLAGLKDDPGLLQAMQGLGGQQGGEGEDAPMPAFGGSAAEAQAIPETSGPAPSSSFARPSPVPLAPTPDRPQLPYGIQVPYQPTVR